MNSEVISFKNVVVSESKNTTYLQPGQYILQIKSAKFVKPLDKKPTGEAKTPYLDILFAGERGQVSTNMYVTAKAFERLQYIHIQYTSKALEKDFDSIDAVGAYFEKLLNDARITSQSKRMIVGGKQANNGKIYAEVPYSNFIISSEDKEFKEEQWETTDSRYIFHVKMNANAAKNQSVSNNDPFLVPSSSEDSDSQLPF